MVGIAAVGGNAMDIDTDERVDGRIGYEDGAGFFEDLATSGVRDCGIVRFDVTAGEQPPVEAAMMDEQETFAIGSQNQAGAGDVAGGEVIAGEGVGDVLEQEEDEFAAFGGLSIGGV
jgi:hypothetical protein